MKTQKAHTTLILAASYFILHYIQAHAIGPEFIRFYGKDLILVPILMLGINAAIETLRIPIEIGIKELITTTLVCTFAFEFIFPKLGMAFAPDLIDIICYFIGAYFYFIAFLSKKRKLKYLPHVGT